MSVLVYRFGLLPPIEEANRVRSQMRLAHQYRNTLIEIERGKRAALRAALSSYSDIQELELAVSKATEEEKTAAIAAKAERSAGKTTKISPEAKKHLADAKAARSIIYAKLRERRNELKNDSTVIAKFDEINERAGELRRSARANCGTYWGTYLLIEDAAQAASKMPLYDGVVPNDPRFVRWNGEGRVGVQIQAQAGDEPFVAENLFGTNSKIRIDAVDEKAWYSPIRGERRRTSRTRLQIRVGSNGRDPIFAAWPMVMHRQIPKTGIIKKATVSLRMIGPREEWAVEFTVANNEVPVFEPGNGSVALDIGWRLVPTGLRVAAWHAEDGSKGELILDQKILSGIKKAEDLHSIRDKNFNIVKAKLVTWLETNRTNCPEWFQQITSHIAMWKSSNRLAALAKKWKDARFIDDEEAYQNLEAWRYHDYHLWTWETSQRTKVLRHRRDIYRCFASALAKKYATIILEDFDLRDMAVRPGPEQEGVNEVARSNRQIASLSELRLIIANAVRAHGRTLHKGKCAYTTITCNECGNVEAFDAANKINNMCNKCKAVWDQDDNAAINLLTQWRERVSDNESTGPARTEKKVSESVGVDESRWVKAKKLRAAKEVRMGTAREAVVK